MVEAAIENRAAAELTEEVRQKAATIMLQDRLGRAIGSATQGSEIMCEFCEVGLGPSM